MNRIKNIIIAILVILPLTATAQVGEYRNDLVFGFSGGAALNKVGFNPNTPQSYHIGPTFGITLRYTSEKYFNSICALQAELNFASLGWKEKIRDKQNREVINLKTNLAEKYSRTMNYIQLPILARMGWGREEKGFQFYICAGPQFGYFLNEKTETNFEYQYRRNTESDNKPASAVDTMEVMPCENKFDYGITAGMGLEYSNPKIGHFAIDIRYYYGLGDFYGSSKKDYFGRSNNGTIIAKFSYLFDIKRTRKN